MSFDDLFEQLTGNPPFPWQGELFQRLCGGIGSRASLDIPTGLGKTSVMAAWLVAMNFASIQRCLLIPANDVGRSDCCQSLLESRNADE